MQEDFKSKMDFYTIETKYSRKTGVREVYPEFLVLENFDDLMVRGKDFYAFWDESKNIWCTEKRKIIRMIDGDVKARASQLRKLEQEKAKKDRDYVPKIVEPCLMLGYSSNLWEKFCKYVASIGNSYVQLDTKLTFADAEIKREDYISRKLSYSIVEGDYSAWDKLVSTLYTEDERQKIEWAIGSILSGDSRTIQKFLVFYGDPGSGKGTIIEIMKKLFAGYWTTFKAENIVKSNDQFNLDFLASNPLLAIDSDAKLNQIETNATLNKLVSHEEVNVNEKFKSRYPVKPICMLVLASNSPVQITNAKSGIIRRLIDINPSGNTFDEDEYFSLMDQVNYELGAIANHCLKVYRSLGKQYYSKYVPLEMIYRTDVFFNFMDESQEAILLNGNRIVGKDLWRMWEDYRQNSGITYDKKKNQVFDEAKNYFEDYKHMTSVNGKSERHVFSKLKLDKFVKKDLDKPKLPKKIDEVVEESTVKKEASYSFGWIHLDQIASVLDKELADYPAQYETDDKEHPLKYKWTNVKSKLKDLDTTKTHYVKGPGKLIFMDFDKRGKDGEKNLELNLRTAVKMAPKKTYVELSNSGVALHAYYWYDGNVEDLSSISDDPEVEIKVFPEDQLRSMRRRVSRCNDLPIAHISSGLPFKEKKNVIDWEGIKDEQHLRNKILQATRKECRPYGEDPKTITCVKYICDMLREAQENGIQYDIKDLENRIESFAANSHHNSKECLNLFYGMELRWPKEEAKSYKTKAADGYSPDAPIIILDCEVVQNLLLIVYKELGPDKKCIRLYNPTIDQVSALLDMKIIGHNVTGYDNFILYAALLGYPPQRIFEISQAIVVHGDRCPFREARNISYTDTLDVASEKKRLKKIEIEMHIPHKEMEIDWSKPLPESEWERLAQYCENDVLATEAYFMSKKWQADFKARKILAALTGMTVNDSTNNLVAQLIFGDVREPWHEFVYPDLKKEFPPYRFEYGRSYYRETANVPKDLNFQDELQKYVKDTKGYSVVSSDEAKRIIELDAIIGEGGRVYAEPGMYYDVVTFDVASMHPTSIIVENGFGPYTKGYKDLYEARIAIKHKDYEKARKLFNGRLAPYLENEDDADDLAYALKIALNSTYGMTAASFQNRFKDPRNIDNWVAKRGALFMEKLRLEVQKRGGHVIHIKTDSIKLVNPTKDLRDFVIQFGKEHGYTFEIESQYERICLVNHAVYIALRSKEDEGWLKECKKAKKKAEENETPYIEPTRWTATGAQFAHPFVFKKLFSKEPMDFWDFCEAKSVKTDMYLDLNEKMQNVEQEEKEKKKIQSRIKKLNKMLETGTDGKKDIMDDDKERIKIELEDLPNDIAVLNEIIKKGHNYVFVGKDGEFMPVKSGSGGGLLMRNDSDSDGKSFVTGTKGYRWVESETLQHNDRWKEFIDIRYFRSLVDEAITAIGQFGDFEMFAKGEEGVILPEERIVEYDTDPWVLPCKSEQYAYCSDCPDFTSDENGYSCKKGYTITNQILGESKEILV